jgi:hypothetical protein
MEIWKPLWNFPSYNGSSEGRIMNVRTQRILKPTPNACGVMRVTLQKNNKQFILPVHKLIANTFLGEHPGMDIRHRDLDRKNNRVDNLYLSTRSETIQDAYDRGSKHPYQSIPIRVVESGDVYDSIKSCALALKCDPAYIRQYFRGERSNVKNLHFEHLSSYHKE